MVALGVVLVIVDAQHNRQVFAFGRSRDDDFPGPALADVVDRALDHLALLVDAIFLDGEDAGAFDHDLDAQAAPRDVGRVGFLERLDLLPVDNQGILCHLNLAIETAIVRVVLEQVGHGWQVTNIVECNHFQLLRVVIAHGLQDLPSNATKTIDTYFRCHNEPPRN